LLAGGAARRAGGRPPLVAGDASTAIAGLPLDLLPGLECRSPAADDVRTLKLFDTLRRWGLRTIGEFAALGRGEVMARFGRHGEAWHRLACGLDPRPLVPDPGVRRFLDSVELEWPIEVLEPLSFVFARLLDPLSLALERADRGAVALRLDLRLVDRTVHTRALQLPAPMRDARVLRTLLLLDLESHPPAAGIDVVTIELDPAPARIVQFSLLQRAIPSAETLATLTARLGALLGEDRCGSAALLDSHRPDAFEMRRFAPDDRAPAAVAAGQVTPEGGRVMVRRFRPPVAIRVTLERGRPLRVAIDRKGMPGGRVVQAAGPWRASGGWWTVDGHWTRDEWDIAVDGGPVCRIFFDHDTQRWFMEGVID
jgi:protein ImuB